MNLLDRTILVAKLIGYAILVGAAIATMIPLLWLVSSSFKTANEIFAVPLKWFPEFPPNVKSSPYIDRDAYPPIKKPNALDQKLWASLQPQISVRIWEEVQKHIAANHRMQNYDEGLNPELQSEMIQGVWKQLIAGLPSEVWSGSTGSILKAIQSAIIPEAIDGVWDSLYREVALGSIQIEELNFNPVPPLPPPAGGHKGGWEGASENMESVREYTGENNGTGFSYHFNKGNTVQIVASIQSPISMDGVRLIRIPVRGDASYHHLHLTIEGGGGVYRSSKSYVLTDSLWHNAIWRIHGEPSQLEAEHIPMSRPPRPRGGPKVQSLAPPVDGGVGRELSYTSPSNTLRLKLEIYRPPYLAICWDKFTHNYRRLWGSVPYNRYFINSVFISTASTLLTLFFCSLGGYAFAKYRFRGQKFLFGMLLASMMIPFQVLLVPLFGVMYDIGWLNSYQAIIIPFSVGAFGIFLMRQFIVSIPSDLMDAARIDGCSEFGIYYRIILPVIKPALGALTIYSFLGSWNSYLWPLIILRDESKYTLPLGLANLVGVYRQEYGMLMAGTLLSLMPIILLFLAMQREFVQGITLGGVKE
ncbi:ABC transporter permease subunit [Candidatus Poribacteria bacterium]|nr:ABC transporter permease subunit [Candidatus Poribacteria bacterium]